jgi:hypothetical protein
MSVVFQTLLLSDSLASNLECFAFSRRTKIDEANSRPAIQRKNSDDIYGLPVLYLFETETD